MSLDRLNENSTVARKHSRCRSGTDRPGGGSRAAPSSSAKFSRSARKRSSRPPHTPPGVCVEVDRRSWEASRAPGWEMLPIRTARHGVDPTRPRAGWRETGRPRRERPKGRSIVIQGFSINGTWPAGLLVALEVVLLTILAVRIGGRRAGRGDPGRGEGRRQGPDGSINSRQVLEEMYARREPSSTDYQKRLRVLRRGA